MKHYLQFKSEHCSNTPNFDLTQQSKSLSTDSVNQFDLELNSKSAVKAKKSNLAFVFFFTLLFSLFGFVQNATSQTTLAVGDVAVLAINSANPDRFSFVFLKDVAATTVVNFTDNGFTAGTTGRTGEGFLTYTVPVGGHLAGTVLTWTNAQAITGTGWSSAAPTNFAFNGSGDQLFAFQGATANWSTQIGITLLFGMNYGIALSATSGASNTVQPTALTSGFLNLPSTTNANGYFANGSSSTTSVTVSGTASALLTLIVDATKWFGTTATAATFPAYSITVGSANPTVNLSVSANAGTEAGATAITVTATASAAVTGDQTVTLGVSGTGITAGDYTLNNTTITIPGGTTTGTVTFTVVDDAVVDGTETATLTISSPSSGITLGATTSQNIIITDNDAPPPLTVNLSVSANAGAETGSTVITVTATAGSAVTGNQTVALAISGTGITAGDYTLGASTITILSGNTTGSVTFTVQDDALFEGTETAILTISAPSAGITLGTTTTQNITITDNDNPSVNLSVSANAGTEAGATVITVTATATGAVTGNQTVDLAVSGTGISAGDYTLSNTQITILNGAITGSVTFTVVDDILDEGTETAILTISNPTAGLTLGTATTQNITITDNDAPAATTLAAGDIAVIGYNTSGSPDNFAILVLKDLTAGTVFYINDNEVASAGGTSFTDLGEVEASFTVKAGQTIPKGTVIILPWGASAVSTSLYDWSSTSGAGLGNNNEELYIYTASSITATTPTAFIYFARIGSSSSSVPAGLTSGTTAISPTGSASRYKISGALYNACQTDLLAAIGNTATNWEAVAPGAAGDWTFTVLTTCAPVLPTVTLSVNSTTGSEAGTTAITVTATASSAVSTDQTVALGVSGTDITAGDYALSNAIITILNGQTTGSVTFTIVDDAEVESTETAILTISSPSAGITLGTTTSQNVAITDNDVAPNPTVSLSVSATTGTEAAQTIITVTATASASVTTDQTVSLAVVGTGITAGDYTLSNTTITIPGVLTTGSVTFTIADDQLVEGAETAILTISNPSSGITLLGTTAQNILITDNDLATTLVFDSTNATVLESVGIARVFLRVTVTGNVPGSVNLAASAYSTATGGGTDYTVPVTLNVPANLAVGTLVSFDFTINDDATVEADEYVICKTIAASNVTIASTAQSTLYIRDNDTQTPVASNQLGLSFVSSFSHGASGVNSAEISAYDIGSKRLFIANSVANKLDIVNFANPAAPVLISSINLGVAPFNGSINSVDIFNGTVALALEGLTDKQANGKVVFTDINGTFISEAAAGAMPDMITFNHAGTKVYTANEGEPNAAYTVDPVGSITIVDIGGGVASPSSSTIGFTAYNGQEIALRSQGIRIYGVKQPGNVASSAAEDFEPEYITISDDDTKAWVALQENNALVELDLTSNTIVKLIPLGYKDHSLTANAMDVSDQTSGINLSNFNVRGMYQPDAITQYTSGGNIYLLTANEGDSRNYTGFSEETRVGAAGFILDPTVYPNSADLKNNLVLGRLTVTNRLGDIDNDGDIDQIYCLGGRSFSIWNPATSSQVFDSKDDLERITANSSAYSQFFNMSNTIANTTVKNRSDDKGPEPEGVTTGKIGNKTYAFVGLERIGGVMIYDITNPAAPVFVTYANSRTIAGGDRGTEGIFFIPANESPNGKGLVVLSNEISSTVSTFEITPCAAPGIAAIANDGNTSICLGSTVRLYNVNSNNTYTYQWLKDGAAIAGAINSDYIVTTSGAYSLVVFNAAGCVDTSAAITVTIVPAATVNLSVSTNTASETAGTVVTVTATASAPVCANQTISLGVTGTGITSADYALSNTTITIPSGATAGSVTFTVLNDNAVETLETAVLTISNPSAGIALGTTTQNIAISDFTFTLQVLHASDFEGAVEAVQDAPRFAAIVDVLEDSYTNTIKLSSGDNYIPGPFLSSGEDPSLSAALKTSYESYYNTTFSSSAINLLPSIGRADISILNFIGIEASALGNHEFDLGTTEVRNIIRGANSSATVRSWFGAQFPYLSSNLNFSGDSNLSAIATTNRLLPNTSFMSSPTETVTAITNKLKLAPSTIIIKGGQKIGIVGATTQVLASISSPGATTVVGGGANDMNILAGIIQPVVNSLIADGCNKIILLSHLQQIAFEKELAGKLTGVDIIMAGGSNTLMADANDRLRAGDAAVESYPFITTGLDGKSLALINTDGNYKYVGRLVVDFDSEGTLIPSSINPVISGVYAADAQGLNDAWGANVGNAFAVGTRGYQVQLLCNAIGNVITVKDGNLFGKTSVFLEGRRNFVRTEETNIGNITAEANLWLAKFYDPSTVISIKNGGGIRSAIGNVIAVGDNVTLTPPIANPSAGKQSGDISQLDIENSLRFNNQLSLMTLTASGLRSILEHAVRATTATATPGQFAQVAGVRYSYDFSRAAGSRILNAVITDASGNAIDNLVVNGTTVGDLSRTFRVVTLNFLAGGGDSYPFNTLGTNRSDLNTLPEQGPATASFTNAGSEQDAFAEYMKNQFSTTAYAIADTPLVQDCRIQRVPARTDNVLPPSAGTNGTLVICNATTVTQAQLFAALGGTPAAGGTWSPVLAGVGVYTYTVTSPSCAGSASATVAVTETNLLASATAGTISCFGGTTTVVVSATGGTAPYTGTGTFTVNAGVYSYSVTDANACTVTTSITILEGTALTDNVTTITACDTYTWNGTVYNATGIYTGSTTNCVTEKLNLTITPSSDNVTTISVCDSYTWNGTVYNATGIYTGSTLNCVTEKLNLTITPSSDNVTTISACDSYTWNGTTYTTSGIKVGTTTNCVTEKLNLTITPSSDNVITISACDSYTWNGTFYNATGIYTGSTTNCVTEKLNLTIVPSPKAGTSGTLSLTTGTIPTNAQLFAVLTGTPDAGGAWSNIGLVYTYTVAATSPCTVAATATVTLTNSIPSALSFCQGARLASAIGTTSLKFYSAVSGGTALAATTALTTRTLYATQTVNGIESTPRVVVAITVNPLPSEVLGAITSSTASATPSGFAAANLAVGQFVGTTTAVSYRIPAFGASGLTYLWKVSAGVTIVGQAANVTEVTQTGTNANILTVHYNNVPTGVGIVGAISVQAVNASGCAGTAKSITVSKVLPTAPSAIRMTNLALPLPVSGIRAAITTFAPYMGTNTELTLTATAAATATSYVWELPTGVNVTNNSATTVGGVLSSTSNVITVNFAGVTSTNTNNYLSTAATPVSTNNLRIGVRSNNGVGLSITNNAALANSSASFPPNSSSAARLLTLTAIRPAAPSALKMFNTAVSSTATVTDISIFIGTSTTLTLVATPSAFAGSYSWELPSTVNFISGDITSNTITINFANVPASTTSLYIGVKAVNGIGSSLTNNSALTSPTTISEARLLKVTAKAPAVTGTVVGNLAICPTTASNVTYSIAIAAVGANTYNVTVPLGCTINGGTNTASIAATSGATFTVNYPAAFVANTTTAIRTITIQSVNGFGVSTTNKVLRLTNVGAVCSTSIVRKADRALSLNEFAAFAYPVPSFDVINIEIQSSSKEASQVQVYDMQGRLIDNFKSNETSFQFGTNYPTGVYNVVVSQGLNVKTLKVIKK